MFNSWQRKPSENEAKELVHDSYVMHIHTNVCRHCGCGERYQTMFEVWTHPTKTHTTGLKQMRPLMTDQLKDLHIAYIELPDQAIPICSDCIQTYKSATDKTPQLAADAGAWADTLRRKYTPEKKEVKIARQYAAGKQIPTLDEL